MEKIIWEDGFSVGNDDMDMQHMKLIGMINELIEHRDEMENNSEVVSDILTKMTDYIKYHFSSEETYMKSIDFPEIVSHELEHLDFIEKTTNFCLGTLTFDKSVYDEVLNFLKEWLLNHILKSDMKYKEYAETL